MRVSLDNLRSGMVLASDVVDGGGRLLLTAGTVLSEKHIRFCQMWGIMEAEIGGDDATLAPEPLAIDPARLAAAEALVGPRFRHCDPAHPVIEAVFRHCVQSVAARQA